MRSSQRPQPWLTDTTTQSKDTEISCVHSTLCLFVCTVQYSTTCTVLRVLGKRLWTLKLNSRFWTTWAFTRDQYSIRFYRRCYRGPAVQVSFPRFRLNYTGLRALDSIRWASGFGLDCSWFQAVGCRAQLCR